MVKYCIIVLTAGRKTAQPIVPARRVARIRAACTLLSRPRPATCREVSRHREASRRYLSSLSLAKHALNLAIIHSLFIPPPLPAVIIRQSISFPFSKSAYHISRHVSRVLPLSSCLHPSLSRVAASTPCVVEDDYGTTSRPSCVSRAFARPLFSGRSFARSRLQQQQQQQ